MSTILTTSWLNRIGRTNAPALNWRAGFEIIEAQVGCGKHFGQHDDLTGVHGEVFGDVEDGVEKVNVVALDLATLREKRGVESAQGGFDFGQGRAEQG